MGPEMAPGRRGIRGRRPAEMKLTYEDKMHIVQELVPGKEISLAHIIASPDPIIYRKMGLDPTIDYNKAAIGIMTMSPSEVSVIAADLAIKSASVDLGFADRFSGTVIITGRMAEVEAAMRAVLRYYRTQLMFEVCEITTT